mmetsp:Transcript_23582/g.80556  ORF Transcript_23582/g.80556 Transcript_23582/m.80556 type:complete len:280 (+) Transcript_23582:248-1087(+)
MVPVSEEIVQQSSPRHLRLPGQRELPRALRLAQSAVAVGVGSALGVDSEVWHGDADHAADSDDAPPLAEASHEVRGLEVLGKVLGEDGVHRPVCEHWQAGGVVPEDADSVSDCRVGGVAPLKVEVLAVSRRRGQVAVDVEPGGVDCGRLVWVVEPPRLCAPHVEEPHVAEARVLVDDVEALLVRGPAAGPRPPRLLRVALRDRLRQRLDEAALGLCVDVDVVVVEPGLYDHRLVAGHVAKVEHHRPPILQSHVVGPAGSALHGQRPEQEARHGATPATP